MAVSSVRASRGVAFGSGVRKLQQAGIEGAATDAMILLGRAVRAPAGKVLTERGRLLAAEELELFNEMIRRRCRRETVSRILGEREFMSLRFEVDGQVLDPRPETELLVQLALEFMDRKDGSHLVLDVGTGSGAIAVSLAVHRPGVRVVATDISRRALAVATRNAAAHGVAGRVFFAGMDLAGGLAAAAGFGLVVSNPPYVAESQVAGLDPEVRLGDPLQALVAGPQGTEYYPPIADAAARLLRPGGALMVEVGQGQASDVARILTGHGFCDEAIFRDLSGVERVVTGVRRDG